MPTLIQIQNMAAAIVVVGSVAAVGFAIATTVEWGISLGKSCLMSEKRERRR